MSEQEKVVAAKAKDHLDNFKFMNADEYSEEELTALSKLYDESFRDIKEGEIISGKIVGINNDNVVLDVGFKSDGTIPKSEFSATRRN